MKKIPDRIELNIDKKAWCINVLICVSIIFMVWVGIK